MIKYSAPHTHTHTDWISLTFTRRMASVLFKCLQGLIPLTHNQLALSFRKCRLLARGTGAKSRVQPIHLCAQCSCTPFSICSFALWLCGVHSHYLLPHSCHATLIINKLNILLSFLPVFEPLANQFFLPIFLSQTHRDNGCVRTLPTIQYKAIFILEMLTKCAVTHARAHTFLQTIDLLVRERCAISL